MGEVGRNTKQEAVLPRNKTIKALQENGAFLMFGTLLGWVRGRCHIEGSGDIDLGMLSPKMIFGHETAGYFAGCPTYFNYKGIPPINVQVFHKIKGKSYCIYNDTIQGGYKIGDIINMDGYLVPSNYEELLAEWYGPDWRTPKEGIHATLQNYTLTPTTKENEAN